MTNKKPAYYVGDAPANSRSPRDFYPTDPRAVEALLKVEDFSGVIWEPACGGGAIVTILNKHYDNVAYSDIYDYGFPGTKIADFFEVETLHHRGSVITNPPYLIKHPTLGRIAVEHWVQHAHKIGIKKSAWLLKTVAIAGKARSKIFQECGLARVHQFRGRLKMMNGTNDPSMMDHAWFIFEHDREEYSPPTIHWIDL